ncbi:MAG: von Willebrand factor type A domain-containing protein [Polyangiaceae bacterium]|nr:von Willebrand factor type A domain-containing protein [Polyangiaceae bacterium]
MRTSLLGTAILVVVGAALAACGSDSGASAPTGSAGASGSGGGGGAVHSSGGGGGYSGASGASNSGGTTSAGAGGGPNTGPQLDAGAEAETGDADLCAALDATKDAVFYLSSDDSNSMASPAIARRLINSGQQVPAHILRTHEFLNYYNVGYPAANAGKLSIVSELAAGDAAGSYDLQIGVASPAATKPRRPMVLTFVLDTSGSMAGEPIELQREAVLAIAAQLEAGDIVSMVTWNTSQQVMLDSHVTTGPTDAKVVSLAKALSAGGGTDLHGGLSKGYALAQKSFDPSKLNRVVLISDGMANVGVTQEKIIGDGAALNDGDGIYLVGIGVGAGVNDTLMNTVTDAGRGAYVYLDTATEAKNMFGKRFDETMDVAARSVAVELRLPWYMGIQKFYGEEYSTNPEVIEPQHLAPDDAMVFNQIVAPCTASAFDGGDPVEVVVRWQLPTGHAKQEASAKTTLGTLLATPPKYLGKAKAIIAYAEALKKPATGAQQLTMAKQLAIAANPAGTDPELNEIVTLIDMAMKVY